MIDQPLAQPSVEGSDIRIGRGSVDVFAAHAGNRYTTKVDASHTPVHELLIVPEAGHNYVPDLRGERYWQWLRAAVRPASVPVGELEEERHGNLP